MNKKWTTQWPGTPGYYWFYGWSFKSEMSNNRDPEMHLVRVYGTAKAGVHAYVTKGYFIYKGDGYGLWTVATMPVPPLIELGLAVAREEANDVLVNPESSD